jgi:uncharacterized lipoprotein YmbA
VRREARPVVVLAAMLVLALAGCGSPPATHYYLLELTPRVDANAPDPAERGLTVGVRPFQVDSPYDQDRIVYRVRDRSAEVGFYAYHRWATPLSRMLPRAVATGLEETEGVRLIEPAVAGRTYDAYLVGRVLTAEEVDHAGGQDVVLRFDLGLRTADGSELWSELVSAEGTIDTQEVGAVVEQMNRVLAQAIEELRGSFAQAITDLRVGD